MIYTPISSEIDNNNTGFKDPPSFLEPVGPTESNCERYDMGSRTYAINVSIDPLTSSKKATIWCSACWRSLKRWKRQWQWQQSLHFHCAHLRNTQTIRRWSGIWWSDSRSHVQQAFKDFMIFKRYCSSNGPQYREVKSDKFSTSYISVIISWERKHCERIGGSHAVSHVEDVLITADLRGYYPTFLRWKEGVPALRSM